MNYSTTTICISDAKPYRVLNFTQEGDKLLTLFNIVPMGGRQWENFINGASEEEMVLNLLPHLDIINGSISLKSNPMPKVGTWVEKPLIDSITAFISKHDRLILQHLTTSYLK